MEQLTKKYRIVYDGENMLFPLKEWEGVTLVGKGRKSFETDSLKEAEQFVKDNNLTYDNL